MSILSEQNEICHFVGNQTDNASCLKNAVCGLSISVSLSIQNDSL